MPIWVIGFLAGVVVHAARVVIHKHHQVPASIVVVEPQASSTTVSGVYTNPVYKDRP